MTSRERRTDRGAAISRRLRAAIGTEVRVARQSAGLSLRTVGSVAACSPATLSRVERGLMVSASIDLLARVCAVVGLDLTARTFPGGEPLRDAAQVRLLAAFRARTSASIRWATEVAFPNVGDQRRWDAVLLGPSWRYGVEAESAPRDWQALAGRMRQKQRDGQVDGVILVLPDTHRTRAFLRAAAPLVSTVFPMPSRPLLARLRVGEDPGGSGIVVLRVSGEQEEHAVSGGSAMGVRGAPAALTVPPGRTRRE